MKTANNHVRPIAFHIGSGSQFCLALMVKVMSESIKINVNRQRSFSAHHMLIGAAEMALDDAKKEKPGWFYNQLITITFSALSIEAIGNTFGKCPKIS